MSVTEEMRLNYRRGLPLIPSHMHDGITRYMERGIRPGSFLLLMLRGELGAAKAHADPTNKACLPEWAVFFADHLPLKAYGTPLKVDAWIAMGGLAGLPDGE